MSFRCRDILDFTRTIVQFFKLEKIEIGGTKGRQLTSNIAQIFEEFKAAVQTFQVVKYDIMDVGARAFDEDFYKFRCAIKGRTPLCLFFLNIKCCVLSVIFFSALDP